MKFTYLFVFILSGALAAAQTPAQTPAKPAAKPAAGARFAVSTTTPQLPPGVPRVRGVLKTAFALKYQDVKVGTGADAVPMKIYKVKYTGYRASDGVKFDSWDMRPQPLRDTDGKPVMGDDGKPKMGDPQPASSPIGIGRVIPGFDQGFTGMKVGGKRRIFIPWQLAYGTREIPAHGPDQPGIPAKSDLIFDVELVDMTDIAMPPNHPGMGMIPGHPAPGAPAPPQPATPPQPK